MSKEIGTTGLVFNEKFLWEKSVPGRSGMSIPSSDVEPSPLDPSLLGDGPDLPDLSEIDVVRHFTRLSQWNYGVDSGTYPLGSCTMKYNPKTNERQAGLPGFAGAHPLLPTELSQGALQLMYELQQYLAEITGLDAVTLQPAAGAHGEMTGMLLVHAFHKQQGKQRSKVIIPDTAHGTNPASVALCGYEPIPVISDERGVIPIKAIEELMDDDVAGIMVTNPNTIGIYEENIEQVAEIIHSRGGLVYGDGANLNAIMGIVQLGRVGIDIVHLNLHKTFTTPHGGGGPGSGPVAVTKELEPFLPVPVVTEEKGIYRLDYDRPETIGKLGAFYGHFSVMVKAYSYIRMMGAEGLKRTSQLAVLNANYVKEQLKDALHLAYDRPCMHEVIFSDKNQQKHHVTTMDMAKRLIDKGFHPPTVYFPLVVDGAIMFEPTESESKDELDQYIAAFKAVAKEAEENPDLLHQAPTKTVVRRLDEVGAARKPHLCG
jgi:glycine dehydrogenase subunit 2